MQDSYSVLKKLLKDELSIQEALSQILEVVECFNTPSKVLPIYRAVKALKEGKSIDFCGHLRQCLCYFPGSIEIAAKYATLIQPNTEKFGFEFVGGRGGGFLDIKSDIVSNYDDLKSSYSFSYRSKRSPSIADGVLYENYGYSSYLSFSQKMLMYFIKNMSKNETLLACLPTGGGKSLSWELPVISKYVAGMAIVVVPTIALADDHKRISLKAFENLEGPKPDSYKGDYDDTRRSEILTKIENGDIPILYISPEALIGEGFQTACLSAAAKGYVSMLVVDEAHLISQWGNHFRPEFQLLSNFRDKLEIEAPNGIKTLLLSATLNQDDTDIIKRVFKSDNFTEFRADALRPEPSYYFHECSSSTERLNLISQIAAKAPRPIIVYGSTIQQSKDYYQRLLSDGYKNIARFTGESNGKDRATLTDRWARNEIDIMVATSAFGMGVDKADVRTIVTAYTPENISRFYQEVGRAGRDGYAALSYWLTFPQIDEGIVSYLTDSSTLTSEKLAERWGQLYDNDRTETSDEIWLNINTVPDDGDTNPTHAGWHKDVVLFMLRNGLLKVVDVNKANNYDYRIKVKLINIAALENKSKLPEYLEGFRSAERERVVNGINSVKTMIKERNSQCFSVSFKREFPLVQTMCNGCPACQYLRTPHDADRIRIISNKTKLFNAEADDDSILKLYPLKRNILLTSKSMDEERIGTIISKLAAQNVNIFIVPKELNGSAILEKLKGLSSKNYLILTLDEANSISKQWINGCCTLFYSLNSLYNAKLYEFSESYLDYDSENRVIQIAPSDTVIARWNKSLSEIVDISIPFDNL